MARRIITNIKGPKGNDGDTPAATDNEIAAQLAAALAPAIAAQNIPAQVSTAVAGSPTVVSAATAAAATAVTAALGNAGVVLRTEPGQPQPRSQEDDIPYSVIFSDLKRSFIECDMTGRPTGWSYQLIGEGMTYARLPTATVSAIVAQAKLAIGDRAFLTTAIDDSLAFTIIFEDGKRSFIECDGAGKPTAWSSQLIYDSIAARVATAVETAAPAASGFATQTADDAVSFAVAFQDGKRSYIECDPNGRPTAWSAQLIYDSIEPKLPSVFGSMAGLSHGARPVSLSTMPQGNTREYPSLIKPLTAPVFLKSQTTASGLYWPWLVDRWQAATATCPADERFALYYSTDHEATHANSGIWLATAPNPLGPFTDKGRIFRDDGGGTQCETPTVLWNETTLKWHMYYQLVGGYGAQSTFVATSDDGLTWARVGIALQQSAYTPGVGHCGYARVFRYCGEWFAYSLHGSVQWALWRSTDGITWTQDPRRIGSWPNQATHLVGYDQAAHWFLSWNRANVIDWRGRLWVIIIAGPKDSSGVIVDHRVTTAPLSPDMRSVCARPIDITPPHQSWEGLLDDTGNIVMWQDRLFYPYRTNTKTGSFGMMEIV